MGVKMKLKHSLGDSNAMKRFLLLLAAFFLIFELAGCDQYSDTDESTRTSEPTYVTLESHSWNFPEFKSLEEFIESYKMVKEGKAVGSLAEAAENTSFIELEKLYVPITIPEGYHLIEIKVLRPLVRFTYLPESHMDSTDVVENASIQDQDFSFYFWRSIDITMDESLRRHRATEEDLIDGKYLFVEPSLLCWAFDGAYFELSMPLLLLDELPDQETKTAEMIRHAVVEVVELGG